MQRKKHLLARKRRRAIAMLAAIGVLVALSLIMSFAISSQSKSSKRALDIYIENQAEIFAKNAAEYLLYKIAKDGNCSISTPFSVVLEEHYIVDVTPTYIYSDAISGCPASAVPLEPVGEADAYGYVQIDVRVSVDENAQVVSEPIRIFRRYIEDITEYLYR